MQLPLIGDISRQVPATRDRRARASLRIRLYRIQEVQGSVEKRTKGCTIPRGHDTTLLVCSRALRPPSIERL